jgi:hypothetical protein
VLTHHEAFNPESIQAFDQRRRQREVKYLQKKAKSLGFILQPATA